MATDRGTELAGLLDRHDALLHRAAKVEHGCERALELIDLIFAPGIDAQEMLNLVRRVRATLHGALDG